MFAVECAALGSEPAYADSFHASADATYLVFDRAGDVFRRTGGSPSLVDEQVAETRTTLWPPTAVASLLSP